MSFTARTLLAVAALSFTTAFGSGCDLIDAIQNEAAGGTTLVQLMVTHHGTPQDGVFPELVVGEATTFDTNEGWTVSLRSAYVTTANAALHECSGETVGFDTFWGPLPEDINRDDLDLLSFASAEVEAGTFCGMTLEYGPYVGDAETTRRYEMGEDAAKVSNATYYFEGVAHKGDIAIDFELTGHDPIVVDLDLSTVMSGGPLEVTTDEPFPIDLTLSKTYDRLFDGIDFEAVEDADLNANIEAVLELETRVAFGTRVDPV